jgi:HK97 family phage major capsid protein
VPTLKEKRDSLEQLKARAGAILAQYKGNVPADKSEEVDRLIGQANELKADIDRELKVAEQTKDLDTLTNWLETPKYQVPHGISDGDGESEDRRALKSAGWTFHDGGAWKMTSLGTEIAMYPEEVLFGELPERDADARKFWTATRAAMRPEYRKAYEHLIRMTGRVPNGLALSMLPADEQKALSEGLDASGGFLVPPDLQAEVLARTAQMSVMRRLARVQTTSRDVLVWPTVQAAAATAGGLASGGGSIFSSGFVGGWVGETPTSTDTDPAFGQFQIPIRKLRVSTRLSNDFVADSAVNVLAFLAQNGAENLALVEDQGFIAGDGSPLQPRGILNGGASTVDVEGSTTDTISNTTSATGSAPKLLDVEYAISAQYVDGSVWLMRRSIEGKVRKLVDASGRFLWMNGTIVGNQYAGRPGNIDDYPVYNSDFMPNDGTNANKVMLFGNVRQAYIIAQRAEITTRVLNERYADTDQVGIILFERVGGDTWNPDAIRYGIV